MIAGLLVVLVLGAFYAALAYAARDRPARPDLVNLDSPAAVRAAVELHRIHREMELALFELEVQRDLDLARRDLDRTFQEIEDENR